jgi:hypothetical protein
VAKHCVALEQRNTQRGPGAAGVDGCHIEGILLKVALLGAQIECLDGRPRSGKRNDIGAATGLVQTVSLEKLGVS